MYGYFNKYSSLYCHKIFKPTCIQIAISQQLLLLLKICGFNRTVAVAKSPVKYYRSCVGNFLVVSSSVLMTRIVRYDLAIKYLWASFPTTCQILKPKNERRLNEILPHLSKTVIGDFARRVHMCHQSRGGP